MDRFYNNDPEPEFPFDDEDEDEEMDRENPTTLYIDEDSLIEAMHMDLAQSELNHHLIGKAIEIASNSFFWRFKSTKTRMKDIEEIYRTLLRITEEEEEEIPDGDL